MNRSLIAILLFLSGCASSGGNHSTYIISDSKVETSPPAPQEEDRSL